MRDTSTAAAVGAAVALAEEHGLRAREPVVLKDSYNVRVHLRPAPVVARIPTVTALGRPDPEEALRRELEVVSYLHRQGTPVVPPSALLPPGPHLRDGFAVSFWEYAEPGPPQEVTPEAAGRALAALHEALRGFPGELPHLGAALDEPAHLLRLLTDDLTPGVFDRLREGLAESGARLRARPAVPVHGDAHAGNLIAAEGGLLWNDFEESMSAPPGWDLACLLRSGRIDGAAAVRAYGADPASPELRDCLAARAVQGVIWMLARARRFPDGRPAAEDALRGWLRARG